MHRRTAVAVTILALLVTLSAPAGAYGLSKQHLRRRPQVVKVVKKRGFSWQDAGVGAAVVGLGVSMAAAGGLLLTQRQRPRAPLK